MTGDEKVKKNRDPIFMVCLAIFVIAAVAVIGVYINDHYIEEDNTEAAYGDKVSVNYTGSFYELVGGENAVIFDTSYSSVAEDEKIIKSNSFTKKSSYSNLTFTIGKHEVLGMFEDAVVGMKVGEKTTVVIPADKGYVGPDSVEAALNSGEVPTTQTIPKDKFKAMYPDIELRDGMVKFTTAYGWDATAAVVDKNMVQIMNNPENGKTYTYTDATLDEKDKKDPFGTVKFKVTAVDDMIKFDYVIDGQKTGGDNGEIKMIEIDLGNGPIFITHVDKDSFTYKTGSETSNEVLYFEIELVKIE